LVLEYIFSMAHEIQIVKVENDDGDGVIVKELLELRPCREHVDEPAQTLDLPMA